MCVSVSCLCLCLRLCQCLRLCVCVAVAQLGFVGMQEPALNVLGQTVEKLTNGSFTQSMLVWAVAMGVGFGVCV